MDTKTNVSEIEVIYSRIQKDVEIAFKALNEERSSNAKKIEKYQTELACLMDKTKSLEEKLSDKSRQSIGMVTAEVHKSKMDHAQIKYEALKAEISELNKKLNNQEQVKNKLDTICRLPSEDNQNYMVLPDLRRKMKEAEHEAISFFDKKCPYCDVELFGGHIRQKIELDHFYPISKGGQDVPWNILPVCTKCNRKKKAMFPFEFLEIERFEYVQAYLVEVRDDLVGKQQALLELSMKTEHILSSVDSPADIRRCFEQLLELYRIEAPKKLTMKPKKIADIHLDAILEYLVKNIDLVSICTGSDWKYLPDNISSTIARYDLDESILYLPVGVLKRLTIQQKGIEENALDWRKKNELRAGNLTLSTYRKAVRCSHLQIASITKCIKHNHVWFAGKN